MKFQDQRCAYLFSALQICSLFFLVFSLIVFMFLHKFCDFFILGMYVQLFVLNPVFLMKIAFVLFLKRFTLMVVALFSVSYLSSSYSTSCCSFLLSLSLTTLFSIVSFLYNCDFLLRIPLYSFRIGHKQALSAKLVMTAL